MPVFDAVGTGTELIKDYRDYVCVHAVIPEGSAIRIERTVNFIDIALLYSAGLNVLSPIILGHVHPHYELLPESQCTAVDAVRLRGRDEGAGAWSGCVAVPTKLDGNSNP